jgi:hypothetical protein
MSCKAKRVIAAAVAAVSVAAVPTIQAVTAAGGVPVACAGTGGNGCAL